MRPLQTEEAPRRSQTPVYSSKTGNGTKVFVFKRIKRKEKKILLQKKRVKEKIITSPPEGALFFFSLSSIKLITPYLQTLNCSDEY